MTSEVRRLIGALCVVVGIGFVARSAIGLIDDQKATPALLAGFLLGTTGVIAGLRASIGPSRTRDLSATQPPSRPPAAEYLFIYVVCLVAGAGIVVAGFVMGGASVVFMTILAVFPLLLGVLGVRAVIAQRNGHD